ncbi:2,3-diphosphoglycerate-dependent phosphoglycerate mutase [Buchnera aphidicola]|uniref:2,3-diphosphoglycerate-dependent phosphoglycerate mutase n=1 Tax=Buchnera aphidicola TaxID=9 RepID=UPI00094CAFD6|nr:2,3-diphosphoglycerate-dependent phosphoglycerate mutase [Buchnera aphidicola]
MKKKKIVLMRHGESQWNQLNQFTGWRDIPLSKKGEEEANYAGKILKKNKFVFDMAYTSVLKRSIHTLWIILNQLDHLWVPVYKSWKLNERHYGALEGLNKKEVEKKYGAKQVILWRRSFKTIPPALHSLDKSYLMNDRKYANLKESEIPLAESLQMTYYRVIDFWKLTIIPQIKKNKNIIIVAHGNSLRALIKYLSVISDTDISNLDIATGSPIIYEFSDQMKPLQYYYL